MTTATANQQLLKKLLIIALAMFGFGFAMVPFYKKICEVTGINNLVQSDKQAVNTQIDTTRWLTVEFDANTRGLPWQFQPVQKSLRVHPGEMVQVMYQARNDSDVLVVGQAIPSYAPQLAGGYFSKIECFCFTRQELKPGEVKQMPVQFVIKPGLPLDVNTVTLSYTFFELNGATGKPG